MRGLIYDGGPYAGWVFLFLTLILGGGLAFATGRAMAQTWRPISQIPAGMAPLALAVRFLHFALFEETLLSWQYFLVTFVISLSNHTMLAYREGAFESVRAFSIRLSSCGTSLLMS